MRKEWLALIVLVCTGVWRASAQQTPLSLEEALRIAENSNYTIILANQTVATAKAEKGVIESAWYPTIALTGEYSHTTSPIGLSSRLGELVSGALGALGTLEGIIPYGPLLEQIIRGVATSEVGLELVPRNTAALGVDIVWPLFGGGGRVRATKIAGEVVDLANESLSRATDEVRNEVITAYFGLSLAEKVVEVRRMQLSSLQTHLHQAARLKEEGMITPAEYLVAKVAVQQATTQLTKAESDRQVALGALCAAMGQREMVPTITTELFRPEGIPTEEFLASRLADNSTLRMLEIRESIATEQTRAEQGAYLPQVALLASHRLWSEGLNPQLFPRTFVGVGMSWTLFDGLGREKRVARSKVAQQSLQTTRKQVTDNLHVAIEKLHAATLTAISEVDALDTTEELAQELVRTTHRAFSEGMATSSEVVDSEVRLAEIRLGRAVALFSADTTLATLLSLCGLGGDYLEYIKSTE